MLPSWRSASQTHTTCWAENDKIPGPPAPLPEITPCWMLTWGLQATSLGFVHVVLPTFVIKLVGTGNDIPALETVVLELSPAELRLISDSGAFIVVSNSDPTVSSGVEGSMAEKAESTQPRVGIELQAALRSDVERGVLSHQWTGQETSR